MAKTKEIPNEKMEKIMALLNENTVEWNTNQKNTMYKALRERFGPEVDELIAEGIGHDSFATFKEISALLNDDSLEMFIHLLFDSLPDMGWKMEAKDEDGKYYRKITYCPKYEMAKKIGAEKLMYLLACCSDHYASKGFNKDIIMTRNSTLMEGGPCCDFCFQMRKK
ncbi:MAG: L-2-amino-thiazoline-4-carboxylic acid hydrolase [Bacilli bacterium]|jgi:hypothetical protein|nr:L-2-amino-thiazoline-4-carboxylic acid hydrolase [Bacilli bacterium]